MKLGLILPNRSYLYGDANLLVELAGRAPSCGIINPHSITLCKGFAVKYQNIM